MTDNDPTYTHLSRLVGWTVSHPVVIRSGYPEDDEHEEPWYGLVLTNPNDKKHQLFVTIFRDPEGNGPGHLDINKERYGT